MAEAAVVPAGFDFGAEVPGVLENPGSGPLVPSFPAVYENEFELGDWGQRRLYDLYANEPFSSVHVYRNLMHAVGRSALGSLASHWGPAVLEFLGVPTSEAAVAGAVAPAAASLLFPGFLDTLLYPEDMRFMDDYRLGRRPRYDFERHSASLMPLSPAGNASFVFSYWSSCSSFSSEEVYLQWDPYVWQENPSGLSFRCEGG